MTALLLRKYCKISSIGTSLLTLLLLLLGIALLSTWNQTKRPYKELWVVDCPILYAPDGKTHIDKTLPAKEVLKTIENEKNWFDLFKVLNITIGNWSVNRKYNSGIIYFYAKDKATLDRLENTIKEKNQIPFIRVLGHDEAETLNSKAIKQTAVLLACYVIAILIIISKMRYKLVLWTGIICVLTLLVNAHNRANTRWQVQVETKVKNNLSPFGQSFGHRHAENLLKSHTGEIAIEILETQGQKSSFRVRNAHDVFSKSVTRKKSEFLWFRSTAKENEVVKAKQTAEDISKSAAKEMQTKKKEENLNQKQGQ